MKDDKGESGYGTDNRIIFLCVFCGGDCVSLIFDSEKMQKMDKGAELI